MLNDTAVHEIHRGRIRTGSTRTRLPACADGLSWYEPGVTPHAAETLAAVVAVATRCAPWVRLYLGPRLWSVCDTADADDYACRPTVRHLPGGRTEYEHHGRACWHDGVILCTSAARLPAALATLHHEVWHEVERTRLAADDVAAVDRAATRGDPRPGDYLACAVERRARLYESWACAWDEGWRPAAVMGWPIRRVDRVCAYVHGGGLARDVARHGAARPQVGVLGMLAQAVAWPPLAIVPPLALAFLLMKVSHG